MEDDHRQDRYTSNYRGNNYRGSGYRENEYRGRGRGGYRGSYRGGGNYGGYSREDERDHYETEPSRDSYTPTRERESLSGSGSNYRGRESGGYRGRADYRANEHYRGSGRAGLKTYNSRYDAHHERSPQQHSSSTNSTNNTPSHSSERINTPPVVTEKENPWLGVLNIKNANVKKQFQEHSDLDEEYEKKLDELKKKRFGLEIAVDNLARMAEKEALQSSLTQEKLDEFTYM